MKNAYFEGRKISEFRAFFQIDESTTGALVEFEDAPYDYPMAVLLSLVVIE